ncbi:hypothetical protein HYV79_01900 [Candidatus Woesearchaeota archaeon]|nr:hypothetical protein [Candidatus Woesearchaeota archaeon]
MFQISVDRDISEAVEEELNSMRFTLCQKHNPPFYFLFVNNKLQVETVLYELKTMYGINAECFKIPEYILDYR